jgi:MoaA/NifB/PqqE/SkfB family radical SAM enzyme
VALEQLHILLTYSCNFECDHCFVYSGPEAAGTFSIGRVRDLLDQAQDIDSIEWIYFEGGEAFLFYPLLLESIRDAASRGYRVGVVTNAYWADAEDDAKLWLEPLAELGVADFSVSDDAFHHGDQQASPAACAALVARKLGMPVASIAIEPPGVQAGTGERGTAVVGGDVMFRGRAADKLTDGLPRRRWESLTECPYEELEHPTRLHVDPFGHVQVCQGISIGNVWEQPLATILAEYQPAAHQICGPLLRGGPAALASAHGVAPDDGYVDECHMCFLTRRSLLGSFPQELAPAQVYG